MEHFPSRAWVHVSENSDGKMILREMIAYFLPGENIRPEMSLGLLQDRLIHVLENRKFLLVLDDVWSDICPIWDNLQPLFRVGANGSIALMTTQMKTVAIVLGTQMKTVPHVPLDVLDWDSFWPLFQHYAFDSKVSRPDF